MLWLPRFGRDILPLLFSWLIRLMVGLAWRGEFRVAGRGLSDWICFSSREAAFASWRTT